MVKILTPFRQYILKRAVFSVLVIFTTVFLVFALGRMAGDPLEAYVSPGETDPELLEQIRAQYHLNEPIPVQFVYWLKGLAEGDWGIAQSHGKQKVLDLIRQYLPYTLELNIYTMLIGLPLGYYLGTKAGINKDGAVDHGVRLIAIIGHSLPTFFTGLLLLGLLYPLGFITLDPTWRFPTVTGMPTIDALLSGNLNNIVEAWKYLIGPLIVGIFGSLATNSRVLRSSIIEELSKEYVTTGRAKGLSKDYVNKKYARRNALIPFVTLTGFWFATLISGNAVLEVVFNRWGVGSIAATAAISTDHNTLQAFTMIFSIMIVTVNFIVDILYGYLDPRIRRGENQ